METPTNPYGPFGCGAKVSYMPHTCLHGNPMDKVCLSDWQQQLLWSLQPAEGLRLNAFRQIRALSPGRRLHSWGLGGDPGGWGGDCREEEPTNGSSSLGVKPHHPPTPTRPHSSLNNHSKVLLNHWGAIQTPCASRLLQACWEVMN